MHVTVVRTGTANIASVLGALGRAGVEATLTSDPGVVRAAERVVLPGVGAFGAALTELRAKGLDDAIVDLVAADRPVL